MSTSRLIRHGKYVCMCVCTCVFADVVVVDQDGNLFDACSYAATAALLTIVHEVL